MSELLSLYSALEDAKDEEWGWGDDANNGAIETSDDDWGDDDWGDDLDSGSNKKGIEMTTPHFSNSNGSFNNHNIVQRRPSSEDESAAMKTPVKSMSLKKSTSVGSNNSNKARASPTPKKLSLGASRMTPSMPQQQLPGSIGGMSMGITSLGPKKQPAAVAKPKKKKLLGAMDDDLFADMGFGGPPKPKAAATPSKPVTPASSSRWATAQPVAPTKTTTAASSPSFSTMTSKPTPAPAPAPTPALIPDGFGDDGLDFGDDDLGLGDAGADGFGDDDDLDDLLNM